VATRGRTTPENTRRAAVAYAAAHDDAAAAEKFDCSRQTIGNWRKKFDDEQEADAAKEVARQAIGKKARQFSRYHDIEAAVNTIMDAAAESDVDPAVFIGQAFGGVFNPEGQPINLAIVYRIDGVEDLGSSTKRGFTPGNTDRQRQTSAGLRLKGERRNETGGR